MSSLLKSAKLAPIALAITLSFIGEGYAQISNGAGAVSGGPSGAASMSGPVGPGLSRMPTTSPAVVPYLTTGGTPAVSQSAGASTDTGVGSSAYGVNAGFKWPYTIARVAVTGAPAVTSNGALVPVASRPYRFAGKLWMRFGTSWFVCSASLIKKGVLITAAHCVHNYGQRGSGWANEVRWYPANWSGSPTLGANFTGAGPWGYYQAAGWTIPTPYFYGTDTCQAGAIGVVCNNDIATVRLAPKNGVYAGQTLGGWYGYAWNGYSFLATPIFGNHTVAQITQLGYPVAIDSGYQMQRGDSFGKYIALTGANGKLLKNTQLGSAMTGGSSGGPWLVNFGTVPTVTGSASLGNAGNRNVVVGTTSWGYTTTGINVQGASWFGQNAEYPLANYGGRGAGNIGFLVNNTCTVGPAFC